MKTNIFSIISCSILLLSACTAYFPDPETASPVLGEQSVSVKDDSVFVSCPIKGPLSGITGGWLSFGKDSLSMTNNVKGTLSNSEIDFSFSVGEEHGDFFYKIRIANNLQTISSDMGRFSVEDKFIHIPDNAFREYIIKNFDKDKDGKLSYREGEEITAIECYDNENISSLTGIEHMPNIKVLWLNHAHLGKLDLNCNKQLATIILDYDSLTELNIEKCTNLQTISCAGNQLEELNVDGCRNLTALRLGSNNLRELNLQNCIYLKELDICLNNISNPDIKGLKNLESFYCLGNPIHSLEIKDLDGLRNLMLGRCPYDDLCLMNLPNLEYLEISETKISKFKFPDMPKLKSLNISYCELESFDFSPFPELDMLACYGNSFTILDLSANPKLSTLWCMYNPYLKTVILKKGVSIGGVTYDRSSSCIPDGVEIVFTD